MTRTPAAWLRAFANFNLQGCLLESRVGDLVDCGPLAKAWEDGTRLYLLLPWFARLSPADGEWHYVGGTSWMLQMASITPHNTTDGCLSFTVPFLGECKIFPPHLRQLDVSHVKGLPVAPERLTAYYLSQFEPRRTGEQFVRA